MRHGRKPCGFTLVELLVVIGIVGLLLAFLLPTLSSAREQSKTVVCLSNLRQMSLAMLAYTQQYKGRYPNLPLTGGGERWPFRLVETGVVKNVPSTFQCPTSSFVGNAGFFGGGRPPGTSYPYVHYSYNSQVESSGVNNRAGGEPRIVPVPNATNIKHTSRLVILYCSATDSKQTTDPNSYPGDNRDFYSAMAYRKFGFHSNRHSRGRVSTWAFADGHVEQRRDIKRETTLTASLLKYKYDDIIDGMTFDPELP